MAPVYNEGDKDHISKWEISFQLSSQQPGCAETHRHSDTQLQTPLPNAILQQQWSASHGIPALSLRQTWSHLDLACIDCLQQRRSHRRLRMHGQDSHLSSKTITGKFQAPFHRSRPPGLLIFSIYIFINIPFPYSFPSYKVSRWRCASCTVG